LPKKLQELKKIYQNVHQVITPIKYFFIKKLKIYSLLSKAVNKIIQDSFADVVVFNTAEPLRHYKIFRNINFDGIRIGIFHNPLYYDMSNKKEIPYFFVLGDFVYLYMKRKKEIDGYFLPYFTKFNKDFPKDTFLKIAVQGWVNYERRDYDFLIDIAKELKKKNIQNIKFDIVGSIKTKGGKRLLDSINKNQLKHYFIIHNSLDDYEFFRCIKSSHFLFALLGKEQEQYFNHKLTGTLTQSASCAIPLILSYDNAKVWGFKEEFSLIYKTKEDLIKKLTTALNDYNQKVSDYKKYISHLITTNKEFLRDLNASKK